MKLVPFIKKIEYYDTDDDQIQYFSFFGNLFLLHFQQHDPLILRCRESVDRKKWITMSLSVYDSHRLSWIKCTDDFIPTHSLVMNSDVTIHIFHHMLVLIFDDDDNWIMLIDLWNMERRKEFQVYDSEFKYKSSVVCRHNELYFFNEKELLLIIIDEKRFSICLNHHTTAKVSKDERNTMVFEHGNEIVMFIWKSTSLEVKTLNTITMKWVEKYIISAEINHPCVFLSVVMNDILYCFAWSRFRYLNVTKINKDSSSGMYDLDNSEEFDLGSYNFFSNIAGSIKLIN